MHPRRPILHAAALVVTSAAILASGASACPHHSTSKTAALSAPRSARMAALVAWKPRAWTPAAPLPAQGLRVAIDPVDGAMGMPPAEEMAQQLVIGDDTPVQIDRAADGTLTAHLDDRWAEFAVATVGPDGKPSWTCVDGRQGAARFMKQPVLPLLPAPVKREDR